MENLICQAMWLITNAISEWDPTDKIQEYLAKQAAFERGVYEQMGKTRQEAAEEAVWDEDVWKEYFDAMGAN